MRQGFGLRIVAWTGSLLLAGPTLTALQAQVLTSEDFKLTASDAAGLDEFGTSVAIDGGVAVVGAPFENSGFGTSGAAYVFRFIGTGWIEEQKLVASDAAANDWYGKTVSISGDVIVVGSPDDDDLGNASGSAYVYRFDGSTWNEEQKLLAGDGAPNDLFGNAVAVSGDVAVIGSPQDDDAGSSSGAAYVFRYTGSTWNEEQKLVGSVATANDLSGEAVAVDGSLIVVGAPKNQAATSGPIGAYVYRFIGSGWNEEAVLAPASGVRSVDRYGDSVDVDGSRVAIGASNDDDRGSAFVFRFSAGSWSLEQKISASDGAMTDGFGSSVSLDDVLVVGAPGDDDGGSGSGSAYVYSFDGSMWMEALKLTASDAGADDEFGLTVAVEGGLAMVGARHDDNIGSNSGSAYAFSLPALALSADPGQVGSGDLLRFTTAAMAQGSPAFLFVVAVNGTPFFAPLVSGTFGTNYTWQFSGTVPAEPNLPGSVLSFCSFGLSPQGKIVQSSVEDVSFQ